MDNMLATNSLNDKLSEYHVDGCSSTCIQTFCTTQGMKTNAQNNAVYALVQCVKQLLICTTENRTNLMHNLERALWTTKRLTHHRPQSLCTTPKLATKVMNNSFHGYIVIEQRY